MDTFGRWPAVVAVCMLAVLAVGTPAGAVEYRMKVANFFDQAMMSFLSWGGLDDGVTGPGFQRLAAQPVQGSGDRGMNVTHRPVNSVPDSIARAWGGVAIRAQIARGGVWDKYVAKSLNLSHGIGAVVGVNNDAVLANLVYIIVEQGSTPTTFEVVITWSNRNAQTPGGGGPVLGTF